MAYTQPPSARYTKLYREVRERIARSPRISCFRVDAPGITSPSRMPARKATPAAMNSGRTSRWNEIPDALAAVSSEWRPSPLTVNTVAISTAKGITTNMISGTAYT